MELTTVREVMVPLDELPTVRTDATLAEAMAVLRSAQQRTSGRLPYRLVLVVDERGSVVGKLGHQGFLRALLESAPRSGPDAEAFARAWVDPDLLSTMTGHLRFFQETFSACCNRAHWVRIGDVMVPVTDSVEENAPLATGIRALLEWQQLSVFVRRGDEVVGLLRQADVFDWIADTVGDPARGSGG